MLLARCDQYAVAGAELPARAIVMVLVKPVAADKVGQAVVGKTARPG